jgi:hypothetical protein
MLTWGSHRNHIRMRIAEHLVSTPINYDRYTNGIRTVVIVVGSWNGSIVEHHTPLDHGREL